MSSVDGRLTVVLADGDAFAATCAGQLLASAQDVRVAAVARSMDELRLLVENEHPELIITETQLRGESVLDVLPELCKLTRVFVLTSDDASSSVLGAIGAGASGYLLKEHAFSGLADALRWCAQGGTVLDERLTAVLFDGYRQMASGRPSLTEVTLSDRALSVLELMAAGLRNRDIAQHLGLSEHTVKVYVGQVLAYLGVPDRTSAVMQAVRRGLVRPPLRDSRKLS